MASAVYRRSLSWTAALAILLAALTLSTGRANGGAGSSCQGFGVAQSVTQGMTPILFVHGIRSNYKTWVSTQPPDGGTVTGTTESPLAYVVNLLGSGNAAGYTFDWSSASGKTGPVGWVTNPPSPTLGERLARAISCVARKADHRVIIIAHSMGGLITQKASALDPTDIAAVFTLGTPYRGSWLASTAVEPGSDHSLNLWVKVTEYLCSSRSHSKPANQPRPNPSLKIHRKPANQPLPSRSLKSHYKPNGAIEAIAGVCPLVNERNDPGVVAMRLSPGPQATLPHPPPGLPWYPLAASVQVPGSRHRRPRSRNLLTTLGTGW